ncbi:nuclear transport factor 2 family protein [Micromonosporaceae bacterium Da 78-11]
MNAFRAAIEARDIDAAIALLADDVVFHSPVVFTPYRGRAVVGVILRAVIEVFEDFRYVREIGAPDGADHALVFQARVGDRQLEGIDLLHVGADGSIDELTVMIRPMQGVLALAEVMKARLT